MQVVKTLEIQRTPRRDDAFFIPRAVTGSDGQFVVDATWGHINPLEIADGVRTVGELEVISHIERGLPLVDTRLAHHFALGTIPTAINIPHSEALMRLDDLDPSVETVLFCNGPQCAATPDAIQQLLAAGYPAGALIYYRGGVHDWVTLGLPLVAATPQESDYDVASDARDAGLPEALEDQVDPETPESAGKAINRQAEEVGGLEDYPYLAEIAARIPDTGYDVDVEFLWGLDLILAGLEGLRAG